MRNRTLHLLLSLTALPVLAHDGHGSAGPHVHGWDVGTLGLAVAVAAVAALWLWRGRK